MSGYSGCQDDPCSLPRLPGDVGVSERRDLILHRHLETFYPPLLKDSSSISVLHIVDIRPCTEPLCPLHPSHSLVCLVLLPSPDSRPGRGSQPWGYYSHSGSGFPVLGLLFLSCKWVLRTETTVPDSWTWSQHWDYCSYSGSALVSGTGTNVPDFRPVHGSRTPSVVFWSCVDTLSYRRR